MNFEYAGFWRRAVAVMIDGVLLMLLSLLLKIISLDSMGVGILLAFLYTPFFESSELQGTPGKALMDLRVVDLNGQRITFKKAVIRYLMRLVSSLILCIGFFMMLFSEKKQTLHDMVAETLVIRGEVKNMNHFQAWYNQVLAVLGMTDKVPTQTEQGRGFTTSASSKATPADLAGLYELYQKGVLTESEYNQKREEILKRL